MKLLRPVPLVALTLALVATSACSAGTPAGNTAAPTAGTEANTVLPKAGSTINDAAGNAMAAATTSSSGGVQPTGAVIRNVAGVLRANLRKPGVMLDGKAITDLRATLPCEGTIVTGASGTTFKWGELGNLAAEVRDGGQVLQLPADAPDGHALTMPRGRDGDNIVSNINMLEMSCQHGG